MSTFQPTPINMNTKKVFSEENHVLPKHKLTKAGLPSDSVLSLNSVLHLLFGDSCSTFDVHMLVQPLSKSRSQKSNVPLLFVCKLGTNLPIP